MPRVARVHGYHGTNRTSAVEILRDRFRLSRNSWDWLGDGIYFWQDAPARAWGWARMRYGDDAAVIHSLIRLEDCMDLLDTVWAAPLNDAYLSLRTLSQRANQPSPRQRRAGGAHRLDRAVINHAVDQLQAQGITIRSVRAVFQEGEPIYPDSHLLTRSHIQIAVRDPALIVRSTRLRR